MKGNPLGFDCGIPVARLRQSNHLGSAPFSRVAPLECATERFAFELRQSHIRLALSVFETLHFGRANLGLLCSASGVHTRSDLRRIFWVRQLRTRPRRSLTCVSDFAGGGISRERDRCVALPFMFEVLHPNLGMRHQSRNSGFGLSATSASRRDS